MKKLSFWSMILLLGIILVECKKEEAGGDSVLIGKFKNSGKYWESDITVNTMIKNREIGNTTANAVVPLIFDENGELLSGLRYNDEFASGELRTKNYRTATTTLEVFRAVTGMSEAVEENVGVIDYSYFFDPYQLSYDGNVGIQMTTPVSMTVESNGYSSSHLKSASIPDWAELGNIVIARWDSINGWPVKSFHAGCIVKEPIITDWDVEAMMTLSVVEAINPNGVAKRSMTNGTDLWNDGRISGRYSLSLSSLNYTKRGEIATYLTGVWKREYKIYSSVVDDKTREMFFYTGKLEWLAYYKKAGVDIDRNGGKFVFLTDILRNQDLFRSESF